MLNLAIQITEQYNPNNIERCNPYIKRYSPYYSVHYNPNNIERCNPYIKQYSPYYSEHYNPNNIERCSPYYSEQYNPNNIKDVIHTLNGAVHTTVNITTQITLNGVIQTLNSVIQSFLSTE